MEEKSVAWQGVTTAPSPTEKVDDFDIWYCCKALTDDKPKVETDEARWKRRRDFMFRVDKISALFEDKLDGAFLEFQVGGKFDTEIISLPASQPKTTKRTDPSGVDRDIVIPEQVTKTHVYVLKPSAARWFTRAINQIKAKKKVQWHDHQFSGEWQGSYLDLDQEYLVVKVWLKRGVHLNLVVGEAKLKLADVANGKMDLVMQVYKKTFSKRNKERIATLNFKIEFQEKHTFVIEFRDWEVSAKDQKSDVHAGKYNCWGCPIHHALEIRINRSRSTFIDSLMVTLYSIFCCASADQATLRLATKQTRDEQTTVRTLRSKPTRQRHLVSYPGTRAWLEDEMLSINYITGGCIDGWFTRCWCRRSIARKDVALQGVLDYGYVVSEMTDINAPLAGLCGYGGEDLGKRSWEVRGVIDSTNEKDVLFTQQGNIDPDTETTWLDKLGKKIRETDFDINFTLLHDTTFLVVKVVRAKGLDIPFADDFKEIINASVTVEWIRVRKQTRVINDNIDPFWDDEVYFKIPQSQNGTKSKLPKYTDFAPEYRNSVVTLSVWDNDRFARTPLGYCEIPFRDIYYKRKLMVITTFTSVSGNPQPHNVYSAKKTLKTPFALAKPAREEQPASDAQDSEPSSFIEFEVYFDRADHADIPVYADVDSGDDVKADEPLVEVPPMDEAMYRRAKGYWDNALQLVPNRNERHFPFAGRDEYTGKVHFLPTFVFPINPPKDIREGGFHELLYFIYSIEVTKWKRDVALNTQGVIVDPEKMKNYDKDLWAWSDPYFFLDKRKGDIKEHAIMLCNFLLGMSDEGFGAPDKGHFDAYVCVGSVLCKGKAPEPHAWVMTKEILNGQKIVRFWETTNGQTYELRDTELFDDLKAIQAKEVKDKPKPTESTEVKEEEEEDDEEPGSQPGSVESKEENKYETKYPQDKGPADDDVKIQINEKVQLDAGEMQALDDSSSDSNASEGDDDLEMFAKTEDHPVKEEAEDIADARRVAKIQHAREIATQRRTRLEETAVASFEEIKKRKKRQTPYKTLDVVFNHKHIYANLQKADPELIKYDFEEPKRWARFGAKNIEDYFKIKELTHFFPVKTLVSVKASKTEVEFAERNIRISLQDSIATYRSFYVQSRTKWLDKFEHQKGDQNQSVTALQYVEQRLEWEYKSGGGLRSQTLMEEKDNTPCPSPKWRTEWRDGILKYYPQSTSYQEKLLHFKHSQANRIAAAIKASCASLLDISDSQKPQYLVGVKLHRLAAGICPVRVFLCVLYTKSTPQK